MASFTQVSPIQYKEYVAQNPVEAMTMVGMQREQKLQEGIQVVNDHYSKVAGVDIMRGVDKEYLQSNLTALKTGITKNLSGDFSDSRITNQITGAARQIYKDPQIQNAIISTAQVRKGMNEMDEARKKGENGPSNDYYFNNQVKEYLQDANPSTSFNSNYEKYTDVSKHVFDIVGKLHPSGTLTDEAFTTDKNGKRVLSESTIRNGFKGVKPDQIRAALRAGLSPQDWRQLELDGVYQYSNMPDAKFADMVQSSYSEIADKYKEKIKLLDNASTTSAYEKGILEQQKKDILSELDNLKNEYDGVTSTFASGDTKSGKAKLHTIRSINHLASSLSFGEVNSTYTGDTPQQMEKWRQETALKTSQWTLKFEQDERFHSEDKAQKAEELRLKKKEVEGYGSLGLPLSQKEVPSLTFEKYNEITKQIDGEIKGVKDEFLSVNKYDPNSKEGKDWYAAKQKTYETKPASLDGITLNHFKAQEVKQREHDSNLALLDELNKKYDSDPAYKKVKDFIPKNSPNISVTHNGEKIIYTPDDFVSLNSKLKGFERTKNIPGPGGSVNITSYDSEQAKKYLSAKEYTLFEMKVKSKYGEADKGEREMVKYLDHYNDLVNKPHGEEVAKMGKDLNEELNKRLLIKQGTTTAIPGITTAQKESLNGVLAQFSDDANQYSNGKIGNTDVESLGKLQKDDKKTITIITTPGNRYQTPVNKLIITGSDGSKHEIPMTEQQKQDVFAGEFSESPTNQAFSHIENQLQKAGGFTTQLGPKPYLGPSDFKSVKNYATQANVKKDPSSGGYILNISVFDPIKNKMTLNIPYPSNTVTTKEGILKVLEGLDDAAIFEMLNQKAPSAKDLDLLQKSAQKPNF